MVLFSQPPTIYFESLTEISWLISCSTFVKVWMTGFYWRIWPSLLWNFSDGVFHLHYGPRGPFMPFIPLGVVKVFKKFEITIFWKNIITYKIFHFFFFSKYVNMASKLEILIKKIILKKKFFTNFCHHFFNYFEILSTCDKFLWNYLL